MLEQALEQMDGIIQGAKYELPQYFETFSLQVGFKYTIIEKCFNIYFVIRTLLQQTQQFLPTISTMR